MSTAAIDWTAYDVVVFDVDGTLYDQLPLRLAMLRLLLRDAALTRSLDTLRMLRTFRRVRERLADAQHPDFTQAQYAETARLHAKAPQEVQRLVDDWLEVRPLALLPAYRAAHVDAVFRGLRAAGKCVAVLSDYPAHAKLHALGLEADPVVCAGDVGCMKPDPAGLAEVLKRAGARAERALMIGDRADRDGAAARRLGMQALIRSSRRLPDFPSFRSYGEPLFRPLFDRADAGLACDG